LLGEQHYPWIAGYGFEIVQFLDQKYVYVYYLVLTLELQLVTGFSLSYLVFGLFFGSNAKRIDSVQRWLQNFRFTCGEKSTSPPQRYFS